MPNRYDWKFLLTLLIPLAGVVVPVWVWQADLSSKDIELSIKSVVEIQPQGVDQIKGLQLSIDGKSLSVPFVSSLELSNVGSKPILAADFEGALRIDVANQAEVVKVQLGQNSPTSLEPKIDLAGGVVLIQPLLLNPSDVIRLTLVTANARPKFSARGRVAGVAEINTIEDQSSLSASRYWLWLTKTITTLLLVIYMVNLSEFVNAVLYKRHFMIYPFATGIVTCFGSTLILVMQRPTDQSFISYSLPILVIGTFISAPIIFVRIWQTEHGAGTA